MMAVILVATLALLVAAPAASSSIPDHGSDCNPIPLCAEGSVLENCECVQAPNVQKRSTPDCHPEVICPVGQIQENCTCIKAPNVQKRSTPDCHPEVICPVGQIQENCTCIKALNVEKRSTSDCHPEVTCPKGQIQENCTCIQSPDSEDSKNKRSVSYPPSHTATDCVEKGISCLQEALQCLEHGCKDCLIKALSCTLESAQCMISILDFHHGLPCGGPYTRKTRSAAPFGTHECRRRGHRCSPGTCICILQPSGHRSCKCTGCCITRDRGSCNYRCVPRYGGNCICRGHKCECA